MKKLTKVANWDSLERIWEHSYKIMDVKSNEHPLLFTESTWNEPANREKLAEIAFEKFNCPGFYLGNHAVLAAFATGRSTCLVVDSGAQSTCVVPVYDGFALKKCANKQQLAGDAITEQARLYFEKENIEIVPQYQVLKKEAVIPDQAPIFTKGLQGSEEYHNLAIKVF